MSGSIVIPLDGSKSAENAVPWAAVLARLYDSGVELLHVVDDERARSAADFSAAEARFARYAAHLASKWNLPRYNATVLQGHTAEAIVTAAADAEFIVLASHGRGGFRAAFVGSVADKVLRSSTVPMVLVPAIGAPLTPDQRALLVALDGSESAERGLELARDVARRMGATVTLVRAWTLPIQATIGHEAYYPSEDLFESIEAGAKEYIAAVALPGEQQVVVMGYPVAAITDLAARLDPDLVVVTTSGKGFAARIAFGSTTERLAHSLHRPLLVVPTGV